MGGVSLCFYNPLAIFAYSITVYNNDTLKTGPKSHVNRPFVAFSWLSVVNHRYKTHMANTEYTISQSQAIFGAGWAEKSVSVGSIDDLDYLWYQKSPHFVTVVCYWPWAAPPLP